MAGDRIDESLRELPVAQDVGGGLGMRHAEHPPFGLHEPGTVRAVFDEQGVVSVRIDLLEEHHSDVVQQSGREAVRCRDAESRRHRRRPGGRRRRMGPELRRSLHPTRRHPSRSHRGKRANRREADDGHREVDVADAPRQPVVRRVREPHDLCGERRVGLDRLADLVDRDVRIVHQHEHPHRGRMSDGDRVETGHERLDVGRWVDVGRSIRSVRSGWGS